MHKEYTQQQKNEQKQAEAHQMMLSLGTFNAENMLDHKRSHREIDYKALSLQMFGSLYDEDDVKEGEEMPEDSPKKKVSRGRASAGTSRGEKPCMRQITTLFLS